MLEWTSWLPWGLWIVLICFILIRVIVSSWEKQNRITIGKAMTIGNRDVQEDNYTVMETNAGILAVLADGMGKQYGGRIASRIAVDTFADIFHDYNAFDNPQYFFRKAFSGANREILNQVDDQKGTASVAAILVRNKKLYYAVVGNVKIAVFRNGDLIPVSEGHTIDVLAQQRYQQGKLTRQDAIALLNRHRLYNFVGQDEFQEIELFDKPLDLKRNDIVLLMSDGLYECVPWKEMEQQLFEGHDCQKIALSLIESVNRSNADWKDNASVVLVRVTEY